MLQPRRQPIKGLQFAILFRWGFPGILDELGQQRKDQACGGDKFGFQHGVIVERLPVLLPGQTVRAMSLGEGQDARPVHGNQVVQVQQAITRQHFLTDQGRDHVGDHRLDLRRLQAGVEGVQRVAVGAGLDAEEGLELGGEGAIVAQELGDLAAGAQAADKH